MSTSLEYEKKGDVFTTQTGPAQGGEFVPEADYGYEQGTGAAPVVGLKRQLKSRHMAMISIGGVIGTGLFLGTGGALHNGGPLGLFMGYAIMGSICYSVMISLGEMVAYLPIAGGHIKLAERFVDPAFSFMLGWNYWYNWVIILPAELAAAAVLISFWTTTINPGVWITICFVVVVFINILGAGAYGEAEFWFASIKVLTITGLIILGIIITAGGGPDGQKIGFKYWVDPGPFTQYHGIPGALGRFLGFWAVLTQAAFSYIGTEIVAIAAGEAKNPRRNLPRAIRRVYVRILVFYLGGTFTIGLLVPSNDTSLTTLSGTLKSPFVIAIKNSGIQTLPSIINACLLTSAWSAASSDLYTSSRALYGLALSGQAPKFFTRTTKSGLPWISVAVCASFGCLAYMSLNSSAGEVFNYFANLTAAAGLITWWGICFIYVRFAKGMKAQGMSRDDLPYKAYLNKGSIAAYYAMFMISIILFFSGFAVFLDGNWSVSDFVTNYFPLWLAPVVYIAAKFWKKSKMIKPEEMDFISNLDEIEADTYDEPPPRNWVEKAWQAIM